MSDQEFVIELDPNATVGHRGVLKADDAEWLKDRARRDPGFTRVRLLPNNKDTEGHAAGDALTVQVIASTDDDDTEGHAISVHFPTREEADAFRRRLLMTGVLVGTFALGAAGGIGLSALQSDDASGAAAAGAATSVQAPTDANRDIGIMDASGAAAAAAAVRAPTDANRDVGIMDASGAAAAAAAVQAPTDANRDVGIMDASGAAAAAASGDDEPSDLVVGPR